MGEAPTQNPKIDPAPPAARRAPTQHRHVITLPHTKRIAITHPAHTTQIHGKSKVWKKYGRKMKKPRKPHHSTISGAVVELRGVAEVNLSTPDHAFFVPKSVKTGQNAARAVSLKHN